MGQAKEVKEMNHAIKRQLFGWWSFDSQTVTAPKVA